MPKNIPKEMIEEIRYRTNIVDVIGQYVQLKKSGKNYLGLCPFHNERTPSFSVAEDKQIFHCFGCGKGGNVFQFVQEVEGVSFPESVEKVAEIGHIEMPDIYKNQPQEYHNERNPQEALLIGLHEKAADLYHHVLLNTKAGEEALNYLKDRGMTEEQIKEFKIGFAPKQRILLRQVFQQEEISEELLEKSGLMVERDNGEWLDRFYQRIMFPIWNAQGKMVAFSGRILPSEDFDTKKQPKYLNSPETDIFNKRQTLYHFHQARSEIRKSNQIVLFEGFMDVISAWGAGVTSGVASMGTSLTNEQIQMIRRIANQVVICYDGDSAGIEATFRGIQLLSQNTNLEIAVASLPEKLDPDEYIRKNGEAAFQDLIKHGTESPFSFKMRYYKQNRNLANEKEKIAYMDDVLQAMEEVPSVIEREVYFKQLSDEFGISLEALTEQFETMKRQNHQQDDFHNYQDPGFHHIPEIYPTYPVKQKRKKDQIIKAEETLIYRIFQESHLVETLKKNQGFGFVHEIYQQLFLLIDGYIAMYGKVEAADFLEFVQEGELRDLVTEILSLEMSEEGSELEIQDCLAVLAKADLQSVLKEKQQAQKEASRVGDKSLELKLAVEIVQLMKQIKN